ncbi:MAG TPA: sulfur carrier protein ThiS adenylyltransferase ThiF [Bacteroidales bacterium]|nr:sulfur carrier protein ThiS adenylyltransferase ThiF [Bacteroidales bacterium]
MRFSEIKDHLSGFRVGIAGAGGLGSNCAVALARSGVGTLVISDFDVIEPANLNRQYFFTSQVGMLKTAALKENIARINPDITVIALAEKLDNINIPEIFAGCDVIVEAFDKDEMKEMLAETVQTRMPGIPLVMGSGLAGWGKSDAIRFRKIDETLYICGDESTTAGDEMPSMAPRVGIVANMQANTVIEILMKKTRDYFRQ